ncbi:hypothetical protein JGH11_14285 [Dysgonomonas sp. Marseille-P4677]|uniref:DUF6348 family protein n=1 Tax=Dysgonomonas sp. Marseille-P4677 TaxID=2364790 RepID=UPI00191205EE|nr:DUF6348 family protein [Dysgonomonas sp. Marseille-P4677]MBK5722044.1 hypothetical protein [Dysgonomonas sp. Marseille-P4677]
MKEDILKQHESRLNNFLAETFRSHHVECSIRDNLIIFPKQRMTACAFLFNKSSSSAQIIQLDVKLEIGLGREIIESSVGMGLNIDITIENAWKNFLKNSFHTLLAAFFSDKFDDQINRYQWQIEGHMYDVVMSRTSIRGNHPEPLPGKWLKQFEDILRNQHLPQGTHWVRLYYAQSESEPISMEILLDNEVWKAVEKKVHSFDFPVYKDFFSLRVFVILRDVADVSHAASVMGWMADQEEELIEKELVKNGLSIPDAQKAIMFIQLAFGRAFLKKITTAEFPDEAIIKDKDEKEFKIDLNSEPFYTEAYILAERIIEKGCVNKEHFQNIVVKSAELNAYNNALSEGVDPEDLNNIRFAPPIIYLPNYQLVEKKDALKSSEQEIDTKKKQFWQFWRK